MSKKVTIDKWSLGYWMLKYLLVRPVHNLYYRKFQVWNHSNIPRNAPVILAPNHQNALMDAMAIVTDVNFQSIFLTRADVFASPLLVKVLTFGKMLPIYRIRDGRASLQKNDEIFDITVAILHNKENPLCIFPEGNHGDKRRLRPLVKGIFRIAFKAQEEYQDKKGVKIVPIGLDYKHYQKFRQTLLINIGTPIEVCEYWEAYRENSVTGTLMLRERLADELKKLMINIETEEYYDLFMALRGIFNKQMRKKLGLHSNKLSDQFIADKKMIDKLDNCLKTDPKNIAALNKIFLEYKKLKENLNFCDWVPANKSYNLIGNLFAIIISMLSLPISIIGLFNNWPHLFLPSKILKSIKDPQFHSTAKWGAGLIMITIYYLILIILAIIFIPFWWLKLIYILTLPVTGIIALTHRNFIIKSWAKIRYTWRVVTKDPKTARLRELYDDLIMSVSDIVDSY